MANANVKVSADAFGGEIAELMNEINDSMSERLATALKAGAEVMKDRLEAASPRGETGGLSRSWKIKRYGRGKNTYYRVGSTKTVKGKGKKDTSLINILEYSTTHGHKFMRQTVDSSQSAVVQAIARKFKEEA